METFEIVTLKTGIKSMRWLERGETFHREGGPAIEARLLHVEQQRLIERSASVSDAFVIWDVGFGAGANALAVLEALKSARRADSATQSHPEIQLHSFDQTLDPIRFALRHASELGYLQGHEALLEVLLKDGQVVLALENLVWTLHLGDFRDHLLRTTLPVPQAILYDPYSPVGNAEMWTLGHFAQIHQRLDPGKPCWLTNYTRSTSMRVALALAGFHVGIGRSVGEKAETTIATNRLEDLDQPLGKKWLERVKASGNSAPLLQSPYTQSRISAEDFELLRCRPQFA